MPQLDSVPRPPCPLGAPGERWGAIDPPELPIATIGLGAGNVFVRNAPEPPHREAGHSNCGTRWLRQLEQNGTTRPIMQRACACSTQ